jgi:anti-sigma factor RsiW
MSAHPTETQLHDYLDGLLGEAERRAVERHVHACGTCRAELEALQALAARLSALPRTIAPATDLLPGIHARIRWGSTSANPSSAGSRLSSAGHRHRAGGRTPSPRLDASRLLRARHPLAAAALLLVALGAVLALLVARDPAPSAAAAGAGYAAGALPPAAELRALEARYTAAARELLVELEALEDALPPGTLDIVRENLRAIDQALEEARLATTSDPGDPDLARLILAAHEKKLDLLRRAAALPLGG